WFSLPSEVGPAGKLDLCGCFVGFPPVFVTEAGPTGESTPGLTPAIPTGARSRPSCRRVRTGRPGNRPRYRLARYDPENGTVPGRSPRPTGARYGRRHSRRGRGGRPGKRPRRRPPPPGPGDGGVSRP